MKKNITVGFIFLLVLTGCEKDNEGIIDERSESKELPMEMSFDAFDNVSVDGEVKVEFNNNSTGKSRSAAKQNNTYSVKINSSSEEREKLTISSEDGTLYIEASEDLDLNDDIIIEVYSEDLAEIKLQNDQHAIFEGYFDQEYLVVVTEANSVLELIDLRVDHLEVRTEGESKVYIDNYEDILEDGVIYEDDRVVQLEDNILLVDGIYLVYADKIEFDDNNWIVYGDEIHSTFKMISCEFKTEGNTYINAAYAPADHISINLEGDSEASIWATETIEGKAEGNSILYYADVAGVDLSNFIIEGSARVLPFYLYED